MWIVEAAVLSLLAVPMGYAAWVIYQAEKKWDGVLRQWEDRP